MKTHSMTLTAAATVAFAGMPCSTFPAPPLDPDPDPAGQSPLALFEVVPMPGREPVLGSQPQIRDAVWDPDVRWRGPD